MAAALPRDKNQKEIIQLLLEHGADPSIRNLDNDQPIHMAPPGKAGEQVWDLLSPARSSVKIFLMCLDVYLVAHVHVNDCVS